MGELKLFALAKDNRLCPGGATWRILARFERLRPVSSPVLGTSTEGCITASAITRVLRESAFRILKVNMSDDVLTLYTPHLLRIGACVLLYEQKKSAVFIKYRLR